MKKGKRQTAIFLLFLCLAAVMLGGCGREFSVRVNEDNTVSIEAKHAKKDYFGGAGSFIVEENQKIVIESNLKGKGEINIRFSGGLDGLGQDAEANEVIEASNADDSVLDVTVSGIAVTEYQLAPGEYLVFAKALSTVSGTVEIRTE